VVKKEVSGCRCWGVMSNYQLSIVHPNTLKPLPSPLERGDKGGFAH